MFVNRILKRENISKMKWGIFGNIFDKNNNNEISDVKKKLDC